MNQTQTIFLALLRAAIRAEASEDPALSQADWEAVFRLSDAHKLLPMILDHVSGFASCRRGLRIERMEGESPKALLSNWREQAIQQIYKQITQENEFLKLMLLLQEQGISPLVMKGPVCRELYPNPWLRPSVDDDLFLSDELFDDCCAAMTACGLRADGTENTAELPWERAYYKPETPLYLELHRRLFDPKSPIFSSFNHAFEGAFERAVSIQLQDVRLRTFAPADQLLYLILHAFKHFLFSGFGIRIVADICLFSERYAEEMDFAALVQRCEQHRCKLFAAAVYQIGARFLAIPAPEPFAAIHVELDPLLEDVLEAGLHGAQLERLHSANIMLGTVEANLMGKRSGASCRQALFPSAEKLGGDYPFLKKHPSLLPVAWARRAGTYVFSRERAQKQTLGAPLRIGKERVRLLKTYGVIPK